MTLHTLSGTTGGPPPPESKDDTEEAADPAVQQGTKKKCGIPNSTLLVPRLVSVAEIIKREYLKKLDASLADGSGSLSGLYQYNELGEAVPSNDESEAVDSEEQRSLAISHALSGKKLYVDLFLRPETPRSYMG